MSKALKNHLMIAMALVLNTICSGPVLAATNPAEVLAISLNPNNNQEENKTILNYEIKATQQIDDLLTVRNVSPTATLNIKLYATDSSQTNSEAVGYKLEKDTQRHLGQWLKLSKETITLKPGETIKVPYSITIPEKVTPGTYQGAIAAENLKTDLIQTSPSNRETKIAVVSRIVEPIIVSIPGRKIINYQLEELSQKSRYCQPEFSYAFENSGNVFLKGDATLTISGTLLNKPTVIDLNHPTILQGDTYQNSFVWNNAPLFGNYHARLDFKVMEYNVATDQLVELKTLSKEIDFLIIPWYHIFATIILLILLAGTIFWFKEQRRVELANTFTHKVKKGDTVTSLAETYQVNWKKIIKLNHLKEPYSLRVGRNLLLPFPTSPTSTPAIDKRKK